MIDLQEIINRINEVEKTNVVLNPVDEDIRTLAIVLKEIVDLYEIKPFIKQHNDVIWSKNWDSEKGQKITDYLKEN